MLPTQRPSPANRATIPIQSATSAKARPRKTTTTPAQTSMLRQVRKWTRGFLDLGGLDAELTPEGSAQTANGFSPLRRSLRPVSSCTNRARRMVVGDDHDCSRDDFIGRVDRARARFHIRVRPPTRTEPFVRRVELTVQENDNDRRKVFASMSSDRNGSSWRRHTTPLVGSECARDLLTPPARQQSFDLPREGNNEQRVCPSRHHHLGGEDQPVTAVPDTDRQLHQ